MKFSGLFTLLFLIYETTFYSVTGQKVQIFGGEKSDCTKLNNFINGDFKDYGNSCSDLDTECDTEGYITDLTIG